MKTKRISLIALCLLPVMFSGCRFLHQIGLEMSPQLTRPEERGKDGMTPAAPPPPGPSRDKTFSELGIPVYPGIRFKSYGNASTTLFTGAIPEEKVDEVFGFYVKRLADSGWERDDELLTGGFPREKSPGELRYAAFEKYRPEAQLFLEIARTPAGMRSSNRRAYVYLSVLRY